MQQEHEYKHFHEAMTVPKIREMNALKCTTLGTMLARILQNAHAIEMLTTACANSESAPVIETHSIGV